MNEDKIDLNNAMIADLHIHSRYSRACSKNISFENLVKYAKIKGLHLLGTGDFTHPKWLEEIKKLREENGIFYYLDFPFILTGEVSLIYTDNGKGRRIHLVLLAPSVEIVERINKYFDSKGRRDYDGRPIFKIPADEFTRQMKAISNEIEIIPAHAWTPWFGIFGSMSGFNSLREAFKEQEREINSIETGMSSDPLMNWKLNFLNNKAIISFSDSHSFWPWRLGREATIFRKVDSYSELIKQIRENSLLGTIETAPEYGKYHYDGHRLCSYSCAPKQCKSNICPVCGEELTVGVESRVEEIGNQKIEENKNKKPYFKILPLHELLAIIYNASIGGKKSWEIYNSLIEKFGSEFNILLKAKEEELNMKIDNKELIEMIIKNRKGELEVKPGYDGVYGKLIWKGREYGEDDDIEREPKENILKRNQQKTLF